MEDGWHDEEVGDDPRWWFLVRDGAVVAHVRQPAGRGGRWRVSFKRGATSDRIEQVWFYDSRADAAKRLKAWAEQQLR